MPYRRQLRGYTPEALANIRYRYEASDEPQEKICADYNIHRKTLDRLARREGWVLRRARAPRDVPAALRMSREADAALRAQPEDAADTAESAGGEDPDGADAAAAPGRLSMAERLERQLDEQLAKMEQMRREAGHQPQSAVEGDQMARTLERLTNTLAKVQKMRTPGARIAEMDDDDWPSDQDAFRDALAARLEALVRTWTDEDYAQPPAARGEGAAG